MSIFCLFSIVSHAQTAQFNFTNTATLLTAAAGPNATSASSGAIASGGCASSTSTGIDLNVPSSQFQTNSIYMEWDYTRFENDANFFQLGDMSINMSGANISISHATNNSGTKVSNTFSNVYSVPSTAILLSFSYDQTTGVTELKANGVTVFSNNGPDNRPLDWSAAGSSAIIGSAMDGGGAANPTLCGFRMWGNTAVPVEFIDVSVSQIDDFSIVEWSTATELNNDVFFIEKSVNGEEFEVLGDIPGAGNSFATLHYSFTDYQESKLSGRIYYRIKQVDFDGKYSYSEVVSLKKTEEGSVSVYPNPLSAGARQLTVSGWEQGTMTTVYSEFGTTLFTSEIGTVNFDYQKKGLYILEIYNENTGLTVLKKVVIL